MTKIDPLASCGNCKHMYYSFKMKKRYCKKFPDGDSVRISEWCPEWEGDKI